MRSARTITTTITSCPVTATTNGASSRSGPLGSRSRKTSENERALSSVVAKKEKREAQRVPQKKACITHTSVVAFHTFIVDDQWPNPN